MTVKGKRARITLDGRAHISARALEHPRIQRTKLAEKLQHELEVMGHDIPEIEVLERMISKFRNLPVSGLDSPWSLVSVEQYPNLFPPEALPSVLRAWVYTRELKIEFTIRQAKWVARLYTILEDIDDLVGEALDYAQIEMIADIIPGPGVIETSGSDLRLFEIMTGEELPLERRCQILGIDKEHFESTAELMTGRKFSLESFEPKSLIRHRLKPGELNHWGDRNWHEKVIEAYSLIMREVKSEEDWLKRIPKLKKLFKELGLEIPEKYKEDTQDERTHTSKE